MGGRSECCAAPVPGVCGAVAAGVEDGAGAGNDALYEAISQNRLALPEASVGALPTTHATADREHSAAPTSDEGLAANDQRSSGELRPVTILCAGLAGEVDSEAAAAGVERLLASLERLLGRYEARLDRVSGDSVIAVFGAAQLHEDDAERAVQAAA